MTETRSLPRPDQPRIVGRSSSHFTRVLRMFAEECRVAYEFQVVSSLLAVEPTAYGGNPALRLPNLVTADGTIFGSLPGCRYLSRLRDEPLRMVWPEQTSSILASNALELTLQAMSSEVSLIMTAATGGEHTAYAAKLRAALDGTLGWLEQNVRDALAELPPRDLSYLELTLFCLVEHLEFRDVTPTNPYRHLRAFRDEFGARPSAAATPFHVDA